MPGKKNPKKASPLLRKLNSPIIKLKRKKKNTGKDDQLRKSSEKLKRLKKQVARRSRRGN